MTTSKLEKIHEVYKFYDDGECVQELDMNEWQCAGISGRQPINEACGGCVGCLLTQSLYNCRDYQLIEESRSSTKVIYQLRF